MERKTRKSKKQDVKTLTVRGVSGLRQSKITLSENPIIKGFRVA
jgi:hypothetical protein